MFTFVGRVESCGNRDEISTGCAPKMRGTTVVRLAVLAACMLSFLIALDVRAQNVISEYAGGGAAGGTALNTDIPGPTSAIRDASGNTYIAAPYSNYIFKLSGGTISAFAGIGIEGYSGDGGSASAAQLALPNGLTIDGSGNIYIADPGTSRIRMVSPAGTITTVAGNGVKCEPSTATCGDGGPALQANFNFPMDVAVDTAGNLFIADAFDNRIRRVDATTKIITTYAGNGTPCSSSTSNCGDGGSPLGPTLNYPQSVAFDSAGNLYIADSQDNKIRMIPVGGSTITTVAGTGAVCTSTAACGDGGPAKSANLHMPMWLFLDPSNNIYIADTWNNKVRLVNAQTGVISTVAGNGVQGLAGDGGLATSAQLNSPASVFLDGSGNLVIADSGNQRVRQVSSGNISTIAGGGLGGDGAAATSAILANPFNVAEDSAGNVYIADTANNRIRMVNKSTGMISTVAGSGIAGYTGDGGLATSAALTGPTGVVVDSNLNLWIADAGNLVIRRVDGTTHIITTYAGTGRSCVSTNPCGDGGPATGATFSTPLSVALDNAGNLYIADYTAHRVREVNAQTQVITTIAGTGTTGTTCKSGLATLAKLNHPSGVAVDSSGNVYIDNSYNNVICRVSGGNISPWALNGAYKFAGDGGPALNASQWNPMEIALDPAGNLFIGGGNNNCIRRVDFLTYTIGSVAGNVGQHCVGGFSGDGGPATTAKIANIGLAADGQSNLYIADSGNNRIRTVHLTPAVSLSKLPGNFGALPIGTTSAPQTFTITSTGGIDLNLASFAFGGNYPGDFAQSATTCSPLPLNLGVDVSCTVTLTFTPQNYGQRTATFIINDNGPNSPQTVALNGYGPYFTVNASPTSLTITPGAVGSATLTIAPLGGFNQTVNLTSSGCPTNSTCTITPSSVTLDGTNSQNATLNIQTSSTTPAGTYNVVGVGKFGSGQLQWRAKIQVTIP